MKSRNPDGTTVMLNEYACAIAGSGHVALDWIGNVRAAPPTNAGPPNGPFVLRVSMTRQGVMPTNTSAFAGAVASIATLEEASAGAVAKLTALVGCQYSGAGQDFRGTA